MTIANPVGAAIEPERPRARFVLGLLAVVGASAYLGVLLVIGLSLGAYWRGLEPQAYAEWFTDNFIYLLPSVMLMLGPALIGVIGSLWLAREDRVARRLWALALAGLVLSSLVTALYHLPANFRIWSGDLTSPELTGELDAWLVWHVVRWLFGLLGAVAGFWAVATWDRARPR
ncbi:MAG: DUF1772 domain-containing protein [Candidatus Limnocylindrales bacterium]